MIKPRRKMGHVGFQWELEFLKLNCLFSVSGERIGMRKRCSLFHSGKSFQFAHFACSFNGLLDGGIATAEVELRVILLQDGAREKGRKTLAKPVEPRI
jgi:hypothetical protein